MSADTPADQVTPALTQGQVDETSALDTRVTSVLSILYGIFTIYSAMQSQLLNIEMMVIHLGFALLIVYTGTRAHNRFPLWLEWAISGPVLVLAAWSLYRIFVGWHSGEIMFRLGDPNALDVVAGTALLVIVLEACRRITGWTLPILTLLFLAYTVTGHVLEGTFSIRPYNLTDIVNHLYLANEGIFSLPLNTSATIIGIFMVLTGFLLVSGAGQMFVDFAVASAGKYRGGAAKSSVIASGLFGMLSGSAIANAVTIGSFTIPLLKRNGYPSHVAAGIEGAASTGGQLAPPIMGAAAFIMADILGIPYAQVAVAAIIPAILYYMALFFMVDAMAYRDNIAATSLQDVPSLKSVILQQGHLILPFLVLVLCVGFLNTSLARAGVLAIASAVVASWFRARSGMGPKKVLEALRAGGAQTVPIAIITATVGIIVGLISLTGLGLSFSDTMVTLANGNAFILLIFGALAALVLGTGLPTVPTYVVLAVTLAPQFIQQGVPPLAAHMFIFYFGIVSDLTPPTALAAFTAAGIAYANPWRTTNTAFKLGINGYLLPFLFVFSPGLLFLGKPFDVILAALVGILMTAALAAALVGYFLGARFGRLERVFLLIGGVAIISPIIEVKASAAILLLCVLAFRLVLRR